MKDNNFVFADLSTYDVPTAKQFYSNVFGWKYQTDGGYSVAHSNSKETSGLYETPQKFKEMGMPSFWMSYIQVKSVDDTVAKAKSLGGIIEVVEEQAIGKVGLIRDPLGAGFTVYEGNQSNSRFENQPNCMVWNELFISDFAKVEPFYAGIFNWSFEQDTDGRYLILNGGKKAIGAIQELSNDIKGKKEYWSVYFGVSDVASVKRRALENGGKLLYEDENLTVLSDPFDAFFHIVQVDVSSKSVNGQTQTKSPMKWKALLGLILIGTSFLTGMYWIWGIFFAAWVIMDLKSGFTHLLEPVSKKENSILYWVIVLMWAALGVVSTLSYIYPS